MNTTLVGTLLHKSKRELAILPKRTSPVSIGLKSEEVLQTWASSYIRAVRQRMVRQEAIMAKMVACVHTLHSSSGLRLESAQQTRHQLPHMILQNIYCSAK